MGYKRRFIGGPSSGVEDTVELEEVAESIAAEDGSLYRRDEILEGGGDFVIYKFDALDDAGSDPSRATEDEVAG